MSNDSEIRFCKKCGRKLPKKYKYQRCESCRNKGISTAKEIGRDVGVVVGAIAGIVITVATGGIIRPKNKF